MVCQKRDFLNEQEKDILDYLRLNLRGEFYPLCKVRLSEFLQPDGEYGTAEFFSEFEKINYLTLPVVIFNTRDNRIETVIAVNENAELQDVLAENHIPLVVIKSPRDLLTSEILLRLYTEKTD